MRSAINDGGKRKTQGAYKEQQTANIYTKHKNYICYIPTRYNTLQLKGYTCCGSQVKRRKKNYNGTTKGTRFILCNDVYTTGVLCGTRRSKNRLYGPAGPRKLFLKVWQKLFLRKSFCFHITTAVETPRDRFFVKSTFINSLLDLSKLYKKSM